MEFVYEKSKLVIDRASQYPSISAFFTNCVDFFERIRECDKILIKINIPYWITPRGSFTGKETLLDLFDFVQMFAKPTFIVESRYNWIPCKVLQEYGIETDHVIDLFERPHFNIPAHTIGRKKLNLAISREAVDPKNFIITVGPPKTHEYVLYSGAIKTKMGFLRKKKRYMHGFSNVKYFEHITKWDPMVNCLHKNLINLNKKVKTDVAILDGSSCMEGNGPVFGKEVNWSLYAISNDPDILDFSISFLMGLDPMEIAYIWANFYKREDLIQNLQQFLFGLVTYQDLGRCFQLPPNYSDELRVSKYTIEQLREEPL